VFCKAVVGFSKPEDEHLERCGVLTSRFRSLLDFAEALDNVVVAMGG
jgi:hypothetical protein